MAQLNDFSGGLNIRKAPHLIATNEAQVYTNIDSSKLSLSPLSLDTDKNTNINRYLINFKGTWISSDRYKDYQEFQEKLYYTDGIDRPKKSSDGILWQNLGIEGPDSVPYVQTDGEGVLSGTLQYCYTYYNINDGTESVPSKYSLETSFDNQKASITVVASNDSQVTHIRLYRLGGNLPTMVLVDELENMTATYTDNIRDLDTIGHVLDSFTNYPPLKGLKYLTENNAMFFGAKKDKLYYSDIAYVDSWDRYNFIDFDDTITGMGPVPNGLLVFTKYKTFIVTGTSPSTLSKYLLSSNQGCLTHKSIQYANNMLIWLSSDGLCTSSGSEILVQSRDKLGKYNVPTEAEDSIVFDDTYYLACENSLLVADFRHGLTFGHITTVADSLCVYDDVLYYTRGGRLYTLGTSRSKRFMSYKSPRLSDGKLSMLKNYKSFYLNCKGNLTISIYIDDNLVITKDVNDTTKEILIPQKSRYGYYLEFLIEGSGELLELEYVVEGRQNGR